MHITTTVILEPAYFFRPNEYILYFPTNIYVLYIYICISDRSWGSSWPWSYGS